MIKKEYRFLKEGMPLSKYAGDAIRQMGQKSMIGGAGLGAGIGAGLGIINNSMKDDSDPTKTRSTLKAALRGAAGGMTTGAAIGFFGGHLARSQAGRNFQNGLIDSAEKELKKQHDIRHFQRYLAQANGDANIAKALLDRDIASGALDRSFNSAIRKGTENAGTLTRIGWGYNPYKTLDLV